MFIVCFLSFPTTDNEARRGGYRAKSWSCGQRGYPKNESVLSRLVTSHTSVRAGLRADQLIRLSQQLAIQRNPIVGVSYDTFKNTL